MKRIQLMTAFLFISLATVVLPLSVTFGADQPDTAADIPSVEIIGDWSINVRVGDKSQAFTVPMPSITTVVDEKYHNLPVFNPSGPSWRKGCPLTGVNAQECCVFDALVPGSVTLKAEDGTVLADGTDYQLDVRSGNIGRLNGGKLTPESVVLASYQFGKMRIDSVVAVADGTWSYIEGTPHAVNPVPTALADGQTRLANIFIYGRIDKLDEACLFPILPLRPRTDTLSDLTKTIPNTLAKLRAGETVRILAWGDSVTACGYIPDNDRWQIQTLRRLEAKYPNARIEMITEAWGGRTTMSYKNEPVGSAKNYQAKVLDVKPDLVISEFVNDAYLNEESVANIYGQTLKDFQAIGAEWIILSPHYVRPDWMGLSSQKACDDDPRPLVKGLRLFAAANPVALADAAIKYGQLYRQGIPYNTLMCNNINHPNQFGMSLFADAILELFDAVDPQPVRPLGVGTSADFRGPVGVNMYSYRVEAGKDLEAAIKRASETGFKEIEASNPFGRTPEEYKALLTKYGMTAVSRNYGYDDWANKLDETVDQAVRLGVKYAGTAWLPFKGKLTEEDVRKAADVFNRAGDALAKHGIKFVLHNHGQEFVPYKDGKMLMDLIMELTNPETVVFEMDITWVMFPGADPIEYLKRYPNRWKLMHVKDFRKTDSGSYGGSVPVGSGIADIPAIFKAAAEAGVEYYHIEDEASQPEIDIPLSLKYMESIRFDK